MQNIMEYLKNREKKSHITSIEAEEAGFTRLARQLKIIDSGFLIIKEEKIKNLLMKCVKMKKDIRYSQIYFKPDNSEGLSEYIECYSLYDKEAKHGWIETLVEKYNKIPPKYVFEKLKTVRNLNLFDYYTVAELGTLTEKQKDPLLLGRLKNESDRFFISQWDDDIKLDDLI